MCVFFFLLILSLSLPSSILQVKNDLQSKVLCMVAIGNIKLRSQMMDDVKVL